MVRTMDEKWLIRASSEGDGINVTVFFATVQKKEKEKPIRKKRREKKRKKGTNRPMEEVLILTMSFSIVGKQYTSTGSYSFLPPYKDPVAVKVATWHPAGKGRITWLEISTTG